jgi:hypothetical protein
MHLANERCPLDLAKATSSHIYGKRCAGCSADLDFVHFRRDSSSRDGFSALCGDCEAEPILSTVEHTSRLAEGNRNSEAVKRQRWEHQEELKCEEARIGRRMFAKDFLGVVRRLVPALYVTPGNIQGHLSIFQTAPCKQSAWGDQDFKYMFYCPDGIMPEYSLYEFDTVRDVPIREHERGWRTVLLRLIKAGLLREETVDKVFGKAEGLASYRYRRLLNEHRNRP